MFEGAFSDELGRTPSLAKYAAVDPRCHNLAFAYDAKEADEIKASFRAEVEGEVALSVEHTIRSATTAKTIDLFGL